MVEQTVAKLREGDEFTLDDGQTWLTAISVRHHHGELSVVLTREQGKHYLDSDQRVVIR